ncbi:uncharacterized protein [Watersipora subatra]|uniref:uncharacterized protein n=1 Tax=Watersipora subatra TaxID=2589382 RepID=UPI00355BBE53
MKHLPFALTAYIVLFTVDALLTNEHIERVSERYHMSIRNNPGLRSLTHSEIEKVMHAIAESQSLPSEESYERLTHCQPRPHIIEEREIRSRLIEQSSRMNTISGYYTVQVNQPGLRQTTSCLLLHRCHKHSGCCTGREEECSVHTSESVNVDVTVASSENGSFVKEITFLNHTACTCKRPTSVQCSCLHPYKNVSTGFLDKPCKCECKPNHASECQQINFGQASIAWSRSRLFAQFETQRHYETCYEKSLLGSWNVSSIFNSAPKIYCPPIPCSSGYTFSSTRLACIPTPSISSQTTDSALSTERRTIREIHDSDYREQLPPSNEATTSISFLTTPTSRQNSMVNQGLNKNRSNNHKKQSNKLRQQIFKKLKRIKSKGLIKSLSTSELARRIYESYSREASRRKGLSRRKDIVVSMHKKGARVTCKPIAKETYYVLTLPSDYLFCSVGVP